MRRQKLFIALLLFVAVSLPETVNAGFITVKNASFESNTDLPFTDGYYGAHNYSVDDWQIILMPASYTPNGGTHRFFTDDWLDPGATDGLSGAFLNNNAYLLQVLDRTFQANDSFELKVDIGWRNDVPWIHEYAIEILAGNTVLASFSDQSILVQGGWATAVASYNYSSSDSYLLGEQLKLKLEKKNTGQINFDNVRLGLTSVPEPTSALGIWCISAFGLVHFRKRAAKARI
jgi:hypothetical protein